MLKFVLVSIYALLVGIRADCILQPATYTETGDALYKRLLADLAAVEVSTARMVKLGEAAGGCTTFHNLDYALQILATIDSDNIWLEKLANGTINPSGLECLSVNTRIQWELDQISDYGTVPNPIPGPSCDQLTGAALYQYQLQRFNQALGGLSRFAGNAGEVDYSYGSTTTGSPPGPWQQTLTNMVAAIGAVGPIIQNNNQAACVETTRKLAIGLQGALSAGGFTTVLV